MSKRISLSEPYLAGQEWTYIKECLDTGWVSSAGRFVDKFEENICAYTKAKYAVAVSSGTAALHTALLITGIQADHEVIVPTVTFIAAINAVRYVNAHPVFMDCDAFYNIDIAKTIEFINQETVFKNGFSVNKKTKRKVTGIVVVHVFGNAVDLLPLKKVCQARNIKIIEDATESLGTFYTTGVLKNKLTGTIGDVGCLSFNGNKIITAGGGGMILTNNRALAQKAKYLTTQAKDDGLYYIHHHVGYNYRLNNIQAAFGVAQLEQLPGFIQIRRNNYRLYQEQIDQIPGLTLNQLPSYAESNCWLYAVLLNVKEYGRSRDQLLKLFQEHQIEVRPLWHLNHLQKPYQHYQHYKIELAYKMLDRTLNLPSSASLTKEDILQIFGLLRKWQRK